MIISGYTVVNQSATIGASSTFFSTGFFKANATSNASASPVAKGVVADRAGKIKATDILAVGFKAADTTDTAFVRPFTIAGTIAAGDEFRVSITFAGGQKRSYMHKAIAGATTATAVAAGLASQIDADETIALGATNSSGVVTATGVAGDDIQFVFTFGKVSASGTIAASGSAVAASPITDAYYWAKRFENIKVADFYAPDDAHDAYTIQYREGGKVKTMAIITHNGVSLTNFTTALGLTSVPFDMV